jgi:hypothetical protein
MSTDRALASALQRFPDITSFEDVVSERFGDIDIASLLVYLIDTVDASALPFLARQFDVDGIKGFGLAQTDEQRRQVVAEAIDLVKLRGTVAGIKRGLEAIGYPNSGVWERPGLLHNGEFFRDGSRLHGFGNWATFAVWVNNNLADPTPGQLNLIRQMIELYKNARSVLVQLVYAAALYDEDGDLIPNVYVVGTGSVTATGNSIESSVGAESYETLDIQAIPPASFDPDETQNITFNGVTYPIPLVVINE